MRNVQGIAAMASNEDTPPTTLHYATCYAMLGAGEERGRACCIYLFQY